MSIYNLLLSFQGFTFEVADLNLSTASHYLFGQSLLLLLKCIVSVNIPVL